MARTPINRTQTSILENSMPNARNKLNASAVHGVLLVAGVVAFLGQSWPVFWLLVDRPAGYIHDGW